MSEYTPTVWRTGDVITAEKLNNIEEGIANAGGGSGFKKIEVLSVDESTNSITFDAKVNDITGISYCVLTDEQIETLALSNILDNTILLGVSVYDEQEQEYYGSIVHFTSDGEAEKGYYSAETINDNLVTAFPR